MNESMPELAADDLLWLEDIDAEASLKWVRERNAQTEEAFFDAAFEADKARIFQIATRPDQIPFIGRRGAHVYNFWQDAQNKRGLWRRTTLANYQSDAPVWSILLDLDALAEQENEDWVWRGCTTLEPQHRRGLVFLSRGGGDAVVVREFDLEQKRFVEGGFFLPEAKGSAGWLDSNTLLVSSSLGSATSSGYARTVRKWKRDTPFENALIVFECEPHEMVVGGWRQREPEVERTVFHRALDFENSETFLENPDGSLWKLDVPLDADAVLHGEWLLVQLRSDWTLPERAFALDSLIAIRLEDFRAGSRDFAVLFEPKPRRTLQNFSWTRSRLILCVLDNLQSKVFVAEPGANGWNIEPLDDIFPNSTLNAWPLDQSSLDAGDEFLLSVSDFLEPATLCLVSEANRIEPLKSAPRAFDSSEYKVSRHEAPSVDGELIPYFQIGPKNQSAPLPTNLYGYGGFEVSLLPHYLGSTGDVWLEWGGVHVVANIRGGGEFGATWHKAGMREGKALTHEDFAAVARDLIARGVTTPAQLAAHGGSNGGLLVGNMLARFPELFGAIWCSVPLLDMKRYSHLLAGASWVSEYGDPDNEDDWAFLRKISPLHNLEPNRTYPPILLITARHDDRVHPAHARKMAARLEELGAKVWFYEPDDGGGHGAANKEQAARLSALGFAFLKRHLSRAA